MKCERRTRAVVPSLGTADLKKEARFDALAFRVRVLARQWAAHKLPLYTARDIWDAAVEAWSLWEPLPDAETPREPRFVMLGVSDTTAETVVRAAVMQQAHPRATPQCSDCHGTRIYQSKTGERWYCRLCYKKRTHAEWVGGGMCSGKLVENRLSNDPFISCGACKMVWHDNELE